MHGTGTALGNAATVFDTSDTQFIPQDPKQRHIIFDIDIVVITVHSKFHRGS
jgi:hypothetical protein